MISSVRHAFTVHDYARMRTSGILGEDDRVELIDGAVRAMSPIGPLHVALVNRLTALFAQALGPAAIVSVQNPIQLNEYTEPQPDLTVLAPRDDWYGSALPTPDDVLLVVEVADSSLAYDRDEKVPRYAASGIAEVLIVDPAAATITQYSQPRNGHYRTMQTSDYDAQITAETLPGVTLSVAQILG